MKLAPEKQAIHKPNRQSRKRGMVNLIATYIPRFLAILSISIAGIGGLASCDKTFVQRESFEAPGNLSATGALQNTIIPKEIAKTVLTASVSGRFRRIAFALKFHLGNSEYIRIGHYDLRQNGTVSGRYFLYRAIDNSQPTQLSNVRHPFISDMADYTRQALRQEGRSPSQLCQRHGSILSRGYIAVPRFNQEVEIQNSTWSADESGFVIHVGDNSYHWLADLDYNSARYFRLVRVNRADITAASGFALIDENEEVLRPVTVADFLPEGYVSEYFHNNQNRVHDQWQYFSSSLSPLDWTATRMGMVNVLTTWNPCPISTGGRIIEMACQSSMMLNAGGRPEFGYSEGGHDYSRNGCLSDTSASGIHEYNHSIVYRFARKKNGKVSGMLFIEQTYQNESNHSYPILSIGIYRPENTQTRPEIHLSVSPDDSDRTGTHFKLGESMRIRWDSIKATSGAYVSEIQLWRYAEFKTRIFRGKAPASGELVWKIDPNLPDDNSYGIRVILSNEVGNPIALDKTGYRLFFTKVR